MKASSKTKNLFPKLAEYHTLNKKAQSTALSTVEQKQQQKLEAFLAANYPVALTLEKEAAARPAQKASAPRVYKSTGKVRTFCAPQPATQYQVPTGSSFGKFQALFVQFLGLLAGEC